jgi:AraC family transcriptional regulator, transcriptional activator of pobA
MVIHGHKFPGAFPAGKHLAREMLYWKCNACSCGEIRRLRVATGSLVAMSLNTAALCQKPAPPGGIPAAFKLARLEDTFDWSTAGDHLDRRSGFGAFWVEEGTGDLVDAGIRIPFGPGCLVFTAPGQLFSWRLDGPVRGLFAQFREEYLSLGTGGPALIEKMPFLFDRPAEATLRLEGRERSELGRMFADLRREAESTDLGHEDQAQAHLILILGRARRLFASRGCEFPREPSSPLASRFRLALAQNFPRVCVGAEYARILSVSRRRLNEELRSQVGRTASELIRDRCILEAKRLLVHSTLTISEIGLQLRFEDPSYFVRFFHRLAGVTPGRYRAAARSGEPLEAQAPSAV